MKVNVATGREVLPSYQSWSLWFTLYKPRSPHQYKLSHRCKFTRTLLRYSGLLYDDVLFRYQQEAKHFWIGSERFSNAC